MNDSSNEGLVAGKVAFVTGAAGGLGRAIVQRLARGGAWGSAIDVVAAQDAASLPDGWAYHHADVTREDDIESAMAATRKRHGGLDIVVANAGIVPPWRETRALDLAEWRRTFAVNVDGVAITIKHAARFLRAGGAIIALGSLNSHHGHPRQAAYVASKHAVLGLVRAAALDLGRSGIRVNALAPGPIATDALLGRVEERAARGGPAAAEALRAMAEATALGRMASEREVAAACVFLASDLASGITGQLIPVDAGLP